MLGAKGLDVVINLDVSTEVVPSPDRRQACLHELWGQLQRRRQPAQGRPGPAMYCGGTLVQRDDDAEDAVKRRLEIYQASDRPVGGLVRGPGAPGDSRCGRRPRRCDWAHVVEAVEAARQRKALRR